MIHLWDIISILPWNMFHIQPRLFIRPVIPKLLEQLFARLRELDPEADTIIQLWKDHPEGISDRAIARELGRPQKTFADQMKKYRTDLRRITGDK